MDEATPRFSLDFRLLGGVGGTLYGKSKVVQIESLIYTHTRGFIERKMKRICIYDTLADRFTYLH